MYIDNETMLLIDTDFITFPFFKITSVLEYCRLWLSEKVKQLD